MAAKTSKKKGRFPLTRTLRYVSQAGFAAYILIMSIRHGLADEATTHLPSIDALCPFGGIATLWRFVSEGLYVPKTHQSNFVLIIGLLIGAVLAGVAFCGWICPFGALQDLLGGIRQRLKIPTINVPSKLDRWLTHGRFVLLAIILYQTISAVHLWFADYDPYRTIFGLGWIFEFDLAAQWIGIVVAIVVLTGSLFIHRFWCRYLCPLGGFLSIVQRVSLFKIQRDPEVCINCGRCAKVCPAKLPVDQAIRTGANCTGCLDCVEICPAPGALEVGFILPHPDKRPAEAQKT